MFVGSAATNSSTIAAAGSGSSIAGASAASMSVSIGNSVGSASGVVERRFVRDGLARLIHNEDMPAAPRQRRWGRLQQRLGGSGCVSGSETMVSSSAAIGARAPVPARPRDRRRSRSRQQLPKRQRSSRPPRQSGSLPRSAVMPPASTSALASVWASASVGLRRHFSGYQRIEVEPERFGDRRLVVMPRFGLGRNIGVICRRHVDVGHLVFRRGGAIGGGLRRRRPARPRHRSER